VSKVDYKKEYAALYKARAGKPVLVDVPPLQYLMIDGEGSPDSKAFADALETLYPVAYTLKFMCKRSPHGIDYGVMPLEGLWWADDMDDFVVRHKDRWKWTLLILQPDVVTAELFAGAVAQVRERKNPALLARVRLERFREGRAAQVLHVGPYSDEGPAIAALHAFIAEQGFKLGGRHHEIYLSDARRTAPARLRTILRQPCTG
jgi:hypothetical protein